MTRDHLHPTLCWQCGKKPGETQLVRKFQTSVLGQTHRLRRIAHRKSPQRCEENVECEICRWPAFGVLCLNLCMNSLLHAGGQIVPGFGELGEGQKVQIRYILGG